MGFARAYYLSVTTEMASQEENRDRQRHNSLSEEEYELINEKEEENEKMEEDQGTPASNDNEGQQEGPLLLNLLGASEYLGPEYHQWLSEMGREEQEVIQRWEDIDKERLLLFTSTIMLNSQNRRNNACLIM